jgi:hypothetical protein
MLLMFVGVYALVHLPFDVFGGYILPKRYGRRHPGRRAFAGVLARGVAVHSTALFLVSALLLFAGRLAGGLGVLLAAMLASLLLLLAFRPLLARVVAPLTFAGTDVIPWREGGNSRATQCIHSSDEGFTGGVSGLLRPRLWLPAHWRDRLGPIGLEIAQRRRELAIETGAWRRGRLAALSFTWIGMAGTALLVGDAALATAAGIIEFSLIFTLWSFLGLLLLPTLSRRGVATVDRRLSACDFRPRDVEETMRRLDDMQDGEPHRAQLVETIFHPIPSVQNRLQQPAGDDRLACWDAARTAVYVSAAGISLLSRAVHCNCGRPALWVFLPVD